MENIVQRARGRYINCALRTKISQLAKRTLQLNYTSRQFLKIICCILTLCCKAAPRGNVKFFDGIDVKCSLIEVCALPTVISLCVKLTVHIYIVCSTHKDFTVGKAHTSIKLHFTSIPTKKYDIFLRCNFATQSQ